VGAMKNPSMRKPYYSEMLLALGSAFHFTEPPPADITSEHYLNSSDPDDVICALVARAQLGDFDHFHKLTTLLMTTRDADTWCSSITLFSYAAPRSAIVGLIKACRQTQCATPENILHSLLIEILTNSGAGWAVTTMLEWLEHDADRQLHSEAPWRLSMMLERDRNEIADGPPVVPQPTEHDWYDPPPVFDDAAFYQRVRSRAAEMLAQMRDTSRWSLFEGELLNLEAIARRLCQRILRNEDPAETEKAMMILAAATGAPFDGFYLHDRLRPLNAMAIVEGLLESGELKRYETGVRYFFGHRIPD
jgi:hypothetical protein